MLEKRSSQHLLRFFVFICTVHPITKKIFCLFALLWLVAIGIAQKQFVFNEKCAQAYQQIISLKIAPAAKIIAAEKLKDPDNLVPYFLENYIDFFTLFFNEEPAEYEKRKPNKALRLDLMKQGPAQSPLTLFTQAIIHLQWAAVEIKFDDRWSGGWAFRDAYKLAQSNQKKFPNFTPNYMITGPMQMVASTIPKNLRWLSNIMGITGDMKRGTELLYRFINSGDAWSKFFLNEGIFYQCYLQFYLLNQPDEALAFIQQHKLDLVNNHLFAYMAANLNINNRKSLLTQQIVQNRAQSPDYLQTEVWDAEMGYARLYHLEPDAGTYFEKFLRTFKGNFYVKDAWLKLGYHYYLQGNKQQYRQCLQNAARYGNTATEADKRALKESHEGKEPNLMLLKARLLTDGGFPSEALRILGGRAATDFDDPAEQLEFSYRLGRIYDELGYDARAIAAYDYTIKTGSRRTEYFAARAALQAGMIFEKKGELSRACSYYHTCIDMEGHDYEDALEQRARAGLQRCQSK